MEKSNHQPRNNFHFNKRQNNSKIVDRLTYNPKKHKLKKTRDLRKKLQEKILPSPKPVITPTTIKFGSMNVNGLDVEATWAVQQLLDHRGFDVRFKEKPTHLNFKLIYVFP